MAMAMVILLADSKSMVGMGTKNGIQKNDDKVCKVLSK
jgi:hypothetical protein